jgi:hypothetical protein
VVELDADHLSAELIANAGQDLGKRPCAALLQCATSTVMIVAAIVSIIGMGEAGTCEHERKGDEERPSGPK